MSINPIIINDASYIGLFYAYEASGGFIMEKGFANTIILPKEKINKYDVTNSLQIKYDVREFNKNIGLYKDASNETITLTSFFNNRFPLDSITLTAGEFSSKIETSNILSVGFYKTLYSNFQSLVNNYFGFPEGFNGLFNVVSQTNINDGVFDASAVINLMRFSSQNASGEYVTTISGGITINNINSLFRFAALNNPFNNRQDKTIEDGFLENDLIYVPTGSTIKLVAKILNSDVSPNNIIPTTNGLNAILNATPGPDFPVPYDPNAYYSQQTTFTATSITRIVRVPVLISLKNLSTE